MLQKKVVGTLEVQISSIKDLPLESSIRSRLSRLRAARGCLEYRFTRSHERPDLWILQSQWSSEEDMENHLGCRDLNDLIQLLAKSSRALQFSTRNGDGTNAL